MSKDKTQMALDGLQSTAMLEGLATKSVGTEALVTRGLSVNGYGRSTAGVINPSSNMIETIRKTTQPRSSVPPKPIPSQKKK